MQHEITVTLEEEDFLEVLRPQGRPRRLSFLLLLLALMIALLIAVLLYRYPEARLALAQSPLIMGLVGAVMLAASLVILLLAAAPALRRRAARSTLNDHPGMGDPIHYRFDADLFDVRSKYAQAAYPWAQLWDWRETDRVLVILPTPRNYYVLPKRDIDPDALERLRAYLGKARKCSTPGK
jgi:hypothetical protein